MNDGSPLYRARFQWQPTLTAHDPDNILTLNPAPVTYTFTGDVALTFTVSSPLAVTHAEPVAVALTFAVSSPQAATYAEPVAVALTFAVESAFEYVAATIEEETPPTGGSGGGGSGSSGAFFPWVRPPRRPVVYEFVGSVAMPRWMVSSWVYGPRYPAHDVMVAAVQWAPEVRHSPVVIHIPRSLRVTQMAEEDELLLIGAL